MPQLPDILQGCKIFPCQVGGKFPLTENGWKDASSDPAQIAAWEAQWPGCNWAVATGLSGLFVFDIDPEGLEAWERIKDGDPELKQQINQSYTVQTPRGGWHHYFIGQGPSTASRIAAGIDTRGGITSDDGLSILSGGYVIVAGGKTSAGEYREVGGRLSPLSEKAKALVPERKKGETHGLEKNPDQDQPRNLAWAVDLLQGYVQSGRVSMQGKGGNDTAYRVIASILDKAISPAACYDLLLEHWNDHCQPPWEDWELEQIIRNAAVYGEDTKGGVKGFQANEDAFAAYAGQSFEPEKPKDEKRRFHVQWIDEFEANAKDPVWLIPGILPAQGIGMIYGASGSFKSFLALDMASCLGHGIPGQWNAPPVTNDVLYLAGEGPIATARKRRPAWREWQDQVGAANRLAIFEHVPPFHDKESWEGIKLDLANLQMRPSLIVVDTLTRLLTGMDENSAKDATMLTGFMEDLARYYECFVLGIHHTGKDEKRGARGSSAFFANMDVALSTQKRNGGTELRVRKQKDADVPEDPFYFQVKEVAASIVLERTEALAEAPKSSKSRVDWASIGEVTKLLAEHGPLSSGMLAQMIADNVNVEVARVRSRLMRSEELRWMRDGEVWSLPNTEYDL